MKKWTLALITAFTCAAFISGCGSSSQETAAQTTAAETTTAEATTAETAAAETTAAETTAAETTTAETTAAEATAAETTAAESAADLTDHTLMIYCGAGMTKPFQEISDAFKALTGCEMNVTYANAGQIQSQINTSQEGDLFIAGSADELKPVADYVAAQKDLVKHIPVLAVQEGNPKEIKGLADLTGEGVALIIGDAEATPIGKIAKKALTDAGILQQVHIEATTATAPQMSAALAASEGDAAIVWKENCDAQGVEIVDTADLDKYIKTIPAASLSCSADSEALSAFNDFLDTDAAREIWLKYGYEIAE